MSQVGLLLLLDGWRCASRTGGGEWHANRQVLSNVAKHHLAHRLEKKVDASGCDGGRESTQQVGGTTYRHALINTPVSMRDASILSYQTNTGQLNGNI